MRERVAEARRRRHRVRGVRPVHDRDADEAARHVGHRALEILERAGGRRSRLVEDGPPDVAGHLVQDRHGEVRRRRVPVVRAHAGPEREAGAGRAEAVGELLDRLHAHARGVRRHRRAVGLQEIRVGAGRVGARDRRGDAQRDRAFRARPDRNPLVGVEAGEREARPEVDEAALLARLVVHRAHLREAAVVRDRRGPRLDEVVAEGEQELGRPDVVPRHAVESVGDARRLTEGSVRDRVVMDPAAAHAGDELVDQSAQRRPGVASDEEDPAPVHRVLGVAGPLDPGGEQPLGLVPRALPEVVALPDHRARVAVRVVEVLQGGVAPRAQPALRHRMVRIALELDRAALAGLDPQPALGRAAATDARVPRRDAGGDLLVPVHVGEEVLDLLCGAAGQGGPGARDADDLEEIPTLDAVGALREIPRHLSLSHHGGGPRLSSSGRPHSRCAPVACRSRGSADGGSRRTSPSCPRARPGRCR